MIQLYKDPKGENVLDDDLDPDDKYKPQPLKRREAISIPNFSFGPSTNTIMMMKDRTKNGSEERYTYTYIATYMYYCIYSMEVRFICLIYNQSLRSISERPRTEVVYIL